MALLAVRSLLILSLGLWSPAVCCCALRAMVAGEAACGADASGGFACCTRGGGQREAERAAPSCCAATDAAAADCESNESPCRCADRVIEQQRLDTSAKLAAPRAMLDSLVAALPARDLSISRAAPAAVLAGARCTSHPPPDTLFARSCLLLL